MNSDLNRATLQSRYWITGQLALDTALHVGGGRETSTVTDSPVIRDPAGEPFIPGSSLKGAFRAAVERLAPLFDLSTCQLSEGYEACLSTSNNLMKSYGNLKEQLGRRLNDNQETRQALGVLGHPDWLVEVRANEDWKLSERHLLALLDEHLCETCKTFGSVHLSSVAFFHDLPVSGEWSNVVQIRDGVGIDRDSERARAQIKFDYEVVPPQTTFAFTLTLENPRARDLALIALGLQEFLRGMVPLGGIRSRGLGRCHLTDVQVEWVDFTDPKQRRDYFVQGTLSKEAGDAFIARHIGALVG